MPDRVFLETYPLYRKFRAEFIAADTNRQARPAINMSCEICKSEQTFNMVGLYGPVGSSHSGSARPYIVDVVYANYRCASCQKFERYFVLKFDDFVEEVSEEGGKEVRRRRPGSVVKVGQYPPWEISVDQVLERMLGDYADYYKKGLVCESQSYGIAAFAYYRRIVEELIDQLLSDISDLLSGEERDRYLAALERTKETHVAREKIDLVKDLLPPILRPNDMNPLSLLHGTLSEGLHANTDERCMELAMNVREILVFLVDQVEASRQRSRRFTDSMRRLLGGRADAAS